MLWCLGFCGCWQEALLSANCLLVTCWLRVDSQVVSFGVVRVIDLVDLLVEVVCWLELLLWVLFNVVVYFVSDC